MRMVIAALGLVLLRVSALTAEVYVTEEKVQIDRCACAWFVSRFLDERAKFDFFPVGKPPANGIGYDYYGAKYFHRGPDCSFVTMVKQHGVASNPAFKGMGDVVNDVTAWQKGPGSLSVLIQNYIQDLHQKGVSDHDILAKTDRVMDVLYFKFQGKEGDMLAPARDAFRKNRDLLFGENAIGITGRVKLVPQAEGIEGGLFKSIWEHGHESN